MKYNNKINVVRAGRLLDSFSLGQLYGAINKKVQPFRCYSEKILQRKKSYIGTKIQVKESYFVTLNF